MYICHIPTPHTHILPSPPPPPPLITLLTSSLPIRPTALSSLLHHLPPGNTQEDHGPGIRAATPSKSLPLPGPQLPSCKEGEEDWRRYTIPKDPASSNNHTGLRMGEGHFEGHPSSPGRFREKEASRRQEGRGVPTGRYRQLGPPRMGALGLDVRVRGNTCRPEGWDGESTTTRGAGVLRSHEWMVKLG